MATPDQTDSVVSDVKPQIVTFDHVENKDPLAPNDMTPRATQQTVIPAGVKGRNVQLIQQFPSLLTVSGLIPTGASAIAEVTTTSNNSQLNIQVVHHQVFVGPSTDVIYRMPEDISSSNFPFYVWNSLNNATIANVVGDIITTQTPALSVYKVQVRNNSGSTQNMIFQFLVRYINNGSDNAPSH